MKTRLLAALSFISIIGTTVCAQTETEENNALDEIRKSILSQRTDIAAIYPYNKADKVEIIVTYTGPIHYETLLKGGEVNVKPDDINGRKVLDKQQVYRLAQLFNNLDPALCSSETDFADPMSPRHLIVFYDKEGKAFTFMEVCLEYLTTNVTDGKIDKHTICDKNAGIFYDLLFELELDLHPSTPTMFEEPIYTGGYDETYYYLTNSETGKTGLKKDQKIIVPVEYDYVFSLGNEGLFQVQLGEKTGFIDEMNRIAIPFEYDVDTLGVVGQIYEIMESDDGVKEVLISSSITRRGFWDGLCAVVKNGKYGYINKKGQPVIPFLYDGACSFSNGYAVVIKNNKYGVIDTKGKVVVDFKYDILYRDMRGGDIAYKIEYDNIYYLDLP